MYLYVKVQGNWIVHLLILHIGKNILTIYSLSIIFHTTSFQLMLLYNKTQEIEHGYKILFGQ